MARRKRKFADVVPGCLLSQLLGREIEGQKLNRAWLWEPLYNFQQQVHNSLVNLINQHKWDSIDSKQESSMGFHHSPITEVYIVEHIILVLSKLGLCCAFCRGLQLWTALFTSSDTGRRLCVVNSSHEEVVRSFFHNKLNQELILVTADKQDNYATLHCSSIALKYISV